VIKLALKLIGLLVSVVVAYLFVTFAQVWLSARHDEARSAQAIVVFGTAQYNGRPSPVLAARLDHAVSLYRRHLAPVIVVTGGNQPGDRFTEAGASADYLHSKNVPDRDILREVSGRTSWQSLAATAHFLDERKIRSVLLVSDPFHSYRIKAMAGELGLNGYPSPTRTSPIGGFTEFKYMGRETLAVGIGRIIGYRREAGVHQVVGSG